MVLLWWVGGVEFLRNLNVGNSFIIGGGRPITNLYKKALGCYCNLYSYGIPSIAQIRCCGSPVMHKDLARGCRSPVFWSARYIDELPLLLLLATFCLILSQLLKHNHLLFLYFSGRFGINHCCTWYAVSSELRVGEGCFTNIEE